MRSSEWADEKPFRSIPGSWRRPMPICNRRWRMDAFARIYFIVWAWWSLRSRHCARLTPADPDLMSPYTEYERQGLRAAREALEKELIRRALRRNKGNITRT